MNYYSENKKSMIKKQLDRYYKNRSQFIEYQKKYNQEHRESISLYTHLYYLHHRERILFNHKIRRRNKPKKEKIIKEKTPKPKKLKVVNDRIVQVRNITDEVLEISFD